MQIKNILFSFLLITGLLLLIPVLAVSSNPEAGSSVYGKVLSDDPGYTYLQATASGRIGELPQFFIMDVSAWYDMFHNLRINLCVKNLLNERYISSRRPQGIRVGLPRLFTSGLSYRF